MNPRQPSLQALVLVCLAAWLPAGCTRANRSASRVFPGAPVVLISIDTLRSDHLPFYGYGQVETPALSALRADSILYERAYTHAPLTLPAHVSIFTGLLPDGHGVHDNLGYAVNPGVPMLAELLGKEGYATGGAVSSIVLSGTSGVGRGFDFWDDDVVPTRAYQALNRVQRPGDEAEASLAAWLEGQKGRPFFAFLHLYEPHSPYEPKEPFKSRYANPYDGEIATADAVTGKLLDFLKAKGLYDRSLIVFLSDHGEALGEHGESEHGVFLYREVLQVPLLVKLPKGAAPAPSTVATPVQLTDVFTTIAKAVALPGFAPPAGTVSLIDIADSLAAPDRRIFAESFFPRIHFGWSELRSLLDGSHHYIEGPRPEFFDLARDPAETSNLIDRKSAPFREMRIEMERLRTAFRAPEAVDAEAAKQLASLGYLSSGATAGDGPLDDPKDHIETVQTMRDALGHFTEGRLEKAVELTGQLLTQNPRMLDVWELRSLALVGLGRKDEALAALRKMVELAPVGSTYYVRLVADHCLEMGKFDEAARHAELAKRLGDPAGDKILARALLAKGDLNGAEAAARASLGAASNGNLGLLVLGKIEVMRGNLPRALELTRQAEEGAAGRGRPIAGLHSLRGDILARMSRHAEAEEEFREETRIHPADLSAWESLVALLAAQNRTRDVRQTIAELIATVPGVDSYLSAIRTLSAVGDAAGARYWQREGLQRFPEDSRLRRLPHPA